MTGSFASAAPFKGRLSMSGRLPIAAQQRTCPQVGVGPGAEMSESNSKGAPRSARIESSQQGVLLTTKEEAQPPAQPRSRVGVEAPLCVTGRIFAQIRCARSDLAFAHQPAFGNPLACRRAVLSSGPNRTHLGSTTSLRHPLAALAPRAQETARHPPRLKMHFSFKVLATS
jgi:hypothetical protein